VSRTGPPARHVRSGPAASGGLGIQLELAGRLRELRPAGSAQHGLSQLIAFRRLAAEHAVRVPPHATIGVGIFYAASHAAVALPEAPYQEHQHTVFDADLRWERTRRRCADGFDELPEGPGLGIEPAPELRAHVVKT
jgi:L-alanine-DL-glutamate epimerase-like enolase superfamily enzyme